MIRTPQLPQLRTRITALVVALMLAIGLASPAAAWWEKGHQTTAEIAMSLVQPATRSSIKEILRHSAALQTPTCPARTIEQASVWPDCIKQLGDRFSYQYNWHFQDVETCKPFSLKEPCAGGNCVSAQIARAQRMVADRKLPWRDRAMALAFLVHFVGDLHQPLHGTEHDGDQGGNRVKVRFHGEETNLHSIWDGKLADPAIDTPPAGAAGILSQIPAEDRAKIAAGTLDDWGRESWELAKKEVYGSVESNICLPTPTTPLELDDATAARLVPIIRLQVAKGGIRLARLLDEALNGDHPEVAHPPKPPRAGDKPAS